MFQCLLGFVESADAELAMNGLGRLRVCADHLAEGDLEILPPVRTEYVESDGVPSFCFIFFFEVVMFYIYSHRLFASCCISLVACQFPFFVKSL